MIRTVTTLQLMAHHVSHDTGLYALFIGAASPTATINANKNGSGKIEMALGGAGGKMALFGGTVRDQPTRAGQLTNNSGGTDGAGTIAAVTDVATAANAIATIAVRFNLLEG